MEYFITIVLAFIVAFSATPIARKVAFKIGAVDVPKDNRRMHKKPIALFGGSAIVCGFVVSILFISLTTSGTWAFSRELLGFLVGILIIATIGVIDDIKHVKAKTKFAFQLAAAIAVVVISDTRILALTNPFSQYGISDLSVYISYPLTIFWIVGITNAINFIDGLDGLAAGVSSISALSLFFVSVLSGTPDPYISILTAALAGATLGFLPFNFNPAKIFMGETGSAFLGFTLGIISIRGTMKAYAAISIVIPILILGLPLFDTTFAILRRIASGKSIAEADRGHLHHRLIDMGLSQKQSVVVMYIASAALGLCAIVLADKGVLSAIILLIAVSVFVIGGARFMNEISDESSDNTDKSVDVSQDPINTLNNTVNENDENSSNVIINEIKN